MVFFPNGNVNVKVAVSLGENIDYLLNELDFEVIFSIFSSVLFPNGMPNPYLLHVLTSKAKDFES